MQIIQTQLEKVKSPISFGVSASHTRRNHDAISMPENSNVFKPSARNKLYVVAGWQVKAHPEPSREKYLSTSFIDVFWRLCFCGPPV